MAFNMETIQEFAEENNLELLEGEEIKPGDFYLGMRNQGPKLLECELVHPERWIQPVEIAYSYDVWECVKVKIL